MNNPKLSDPKEHIDEIVPGAIYRIPTYEVTSDGLKNGNNPGEIHFCKGSKDDESVPRQEGVFAETLIQVAKLYLESVNVGELASRETSMAITKLDEALMWIDKRANDRKRRGVQTTYKK